MRIGYAKLGRSWSLDEKRASTVGGDLDVLRALKRLATKYPQHEFFLIGKNTGETPYDVGLPANVVNPWVKSGWNIPTISAPMVKADPSVIDRPIRQFEEISREFRLDKMILWMGQHSSSNMPIPAIGANWATGPMTMPLVSAVNYGGYLVDYCNRMNLEPLFLVPDPRNYVKCRDLRVDIKKPVLAQYRVTHKYKQDRGPDDQRGVTTIDQQYIYAALELTALDEPEKIKFDPSRESWERRTNFVLISNENKRDVTHPRGPLVKKWVCDAFPEAVIYGSWSDDGKKEIGRDPLPLPTPLMYDTLRSARATMTFPASGSGWVTSKIWECFAAGVVCFIHPRYDTQGHAVFRDHTEELSAFLHVNLVSDLRERVEQLKNNYDLWVKICQMQRELFEKRFAESYGGILQIEKYAGLVDVYG